MHRRWFALAPALLIVCATLFVGMSVSFAADDTNGSQVIFADVACTSLIPVYQDVSAEAVVPNHVDQGASYTVKIPGGTTELPYSQSGLSVTQFKNLAQTYQFASSSGDVQITNVTADGSATNTPNVEISAIAFSSAGGGTYTITTVSPHGVVAGDHVSLINNVPVEYNQSNLTVAAKTSDTVFTITGIGSNPGALTTKGAVTTPTKTLASSSSTAARTLSVNKAVYNSGGNYYEYTTTTPHALNVGTFVAISGMTPSGYNKTNAAVTATPTGATFRINAGGIAQVNATAFGAVTPKESGIVTLSTPSTQPGILKTPDVTVTITAPSADVTVTSYMIGITLTASLLIGLEAPVTCPIPHGSPQSDGISATAVGTGGPTTTSQPGCRLPATTTTTTPPHQACNGGPTTTTSTSTSTSTSTTTSTTTIPETTTSTVPDTTTTTVTVPASTTTTTAAAPETTTTTVTVPPPTTTTTSTTTTSTSTTTTTVPQTTTTVPQTTTTVTVPSTTTTVTAPPTSTTTEQPTTTTTLGSTTTTTVAALGPVVSDSTVSPGGKITVTDTGWMPDSQVDLELHSDPVNLGRATVGDDGAFSKEVTIPADTREGTHTIVITGTGDDQQPQTHSVEIKVSSEVVDNGSTTTTTTASGGSGGGGGSLPFTGGPAMPLVVVSVAMILAGVGLGARRRRDV